MPSAKPNDVRSISDSEECEHDDDINFSQHHSVSMRSTHPKPSRPATACPVRRISSATSLRRSRMTKSSVNLTKCQSSVQVSTDIWNCSPNCNLTSVNP